MIPNARVRSRGMDRYASGDRCAARISRSVTPVDARGSSRAFEKPEDARDDPSVDALPEELAEELANR